MRVNHKDFAYFEYTPYFDRNGRPMTKKPAGCPYDLGDVVVVIETNSIGVVLGCICEDGDLRTDADGMQCWSSPGYLRKATKKDFLDESLQCTAKLRKVSMGKSKGRSPKEALSI